jgi:hypothetical protein
VSQPPPPALDAVYVRAERIVGRAIEGEYLLVPIMGKAADVDSIFNLNATGAFIWQALDGIRSGWDIVAMLTDAFDVERDRAENDYREFVAQLLSIGALEAVAGVDADLPPSNSSGEA